MNIITAQKCLILSVCMVFLQFASHEAIAATPESLCPSKVLQEGNVSGRMQTVGATESLVYYATVLLDNGEKWEAPFHYRDTQKIASFIGDHVVVDYMVYQYWDAQYADCIRSIEIDDVRRIAK